MDSKSKELELTIDIAQQAGALLMSYVGQDLKRNIKRHQDDFSTEHSAHDDRCARCS